MVSGLTITAAQADDLMGMDLRMTEAAVNHLVRVPVTQARFEALVSLTYNVGCGNLASSTLLRDVNAGNVIDADRQSVCWDRAGGIEVLALRICRLAEAKMFAQAAPTTCTTAVPPSL